MRMRIGKLPHFIVNFQLPENGSRLPCLGTDRILSQNAIRQPSGPRAPSPFIRGAWRDVLKFEVSRLYQFFSAGQSNLPDGRVKRVVQDDADEYDHTDIVIVQECGEAPGRLSVAGEPQVIGHQYCSQGH